MSNVVGGIPVGRGKSETLDEIGLTILRELVRDSRIKLKEMSARVGLSTSSITERIKRMEEEGIIHGYTTIINEEKLGFAIHAMISIKSHSPADEKKLFEKLPKMPPVLRIWNLTGDRDLLVEALFISTKEMSDFLIAITTNGQSFTSVILDKTMPDFQRTYLNDSNDAK